MRLTPTLLAIAAVATPATAAAAPIGPVSTVEIRLGAELTDKDDVIGEREARMLSESLRDNVVRAVGGLSDAGGVLVLTIEDAKPNRPTMTQMRKRPGLSLAESFGIGGAEVTGTYVAPGGEATEVSYRWYESDIRNAQYVGEWHDADKTFRRFADRLTDE
jgi:hypothetical protein